MICVSVRHIDQLAGLSGDGIKFVELRLDLMGESPVQIIPLVHERFKVIATCRPGKLSDQERIDILSEAVTLGVDYVDIEIETDDRYFKPILDLAKQESCDVIISWHNFERTPDRSELLTILDNCYNRGGDVAKIATMVRNREDMLRLISLYELPGRKVVVGMGEMASITRIIAPLLGAEFTFAATDKSSITAPGQLTTEELLTVYNILNLA